MGVTTQVSPQGTLNKTDYKSLAITAGLFGLSAIITYLLTQVGSLHLSDGLALVVTTILGLILKAIQKYTDGPKA